ncbi:MAG: PEP-CTERM sorting domain-containing protein [Planctomycetota bacterium]
MSITRSVGLTLLWIGLAGPASAVLVSPRLDYRHEATAVLPPPNSSTPATQDRDLFEDTAFGFGVTELTAVGQLGISEAEVSVDATINPTQVLLDGNVSFSTNNGESASASTRNTVRFTLDQPAQVSYTGNLAVGAGRFAFAVFGFNGPEGSLDSVVLSDDDNSTLGGTYQLEPGQYSFVLNANQNTQRSGNTYIVREGTASFDLNAIFVALAGLAGDFNDSGAVEQGDLNLVLNNWGGNRTFEDGTTAFTTNNVDQEELNAVLNNWGSSSAPSFAGFDVPEPAMLGLWGAGMMCLTGRRR